MNFIVFSLHKTMFACFPKAYLLLKKEYAITAIIPYMKVIFAYKKPSYLSILQAFHNSPGNRTITLNNPVAQPVGF